MKSNHDDISDAERARRATQKLRSEIEAAERLHQKPQTLAQWRCEKKGPPYLKIGRRVFYTDDDLDNFILAQRRDPTKPSTKAA
jgi:hypothetical protein